DHLRPRRARPRRQSGRHPGARRAQPRGHDRGGRGRGVGAAGRTAEGVPDMSEWIDLRSDTVTRPDAEMRRAMAEAEVGDDVYGEDPTVRRVEEEGAAAVGMEAALFMPSGTMGNEVALHLLGRPGGEVVCDAESHIVWFEASGMAALSGLLPRTIPSHRG